MKTFSFETMNSFESFEHGMEGLDETRLSVSGSDTHDNFLTDEPVPESWDDIQPLTGSFDELV